MSRLTTKQRRARARNRYPRREWDFVVYGAWKVHAAEVVAWLDRTDECPAGALSEMPTQVLRDVARTMVGRMTLDEG